MKRRTGLVLAGLAVLGASFGIGTAIATAQTTTTPKSPSTTSPNSNTPSTPHTCPHDNGQNGGSPSGYGPNGSGQANTQSSL